MTAESEDSIKVAELDAMSFGDGDVLNPVQECALSCKKRLVLIPRKYENLYATGDRIKNILESYPGLFNDSPLKGFEYNFYPDLNRERIITAILTEDAWDPHREGCHIPKDDTICFELVEGSAEDFELSISEGSTGSPRAGHLEVVLKVLKLHKEDQISKHQKVKIRATTKDGAMDELELTIHRNEDVNDNFKAVLDKETILVEQGNEFVKSEGVKELQRLLNQVVARHKAANNFEFITIDSEFRSEVAKEVKAFLDNFKGDFNYEKGHFNVKMDEALKKYIEAEYGSYEDGKVVDKCLLVGEKEWTEGESYKNADGLLDIYKGVVRLFFRKMEEMAQSYTTGFVTNWLHRPVDKPYEKGDEVDDFFVLKSESLNIRDDANGPTILDTVKKGATLEYKNEKKTVEGKVWYKVKTQSNKEGWCASWHLNKLTNDTQKSDKNKGNYGVTGVAYSMGGKDLPSAFDDRLTENTPKPSNIKSWTQYNWKHENQDVPGGPGDDWKRGPGNGCDCGGFVSNCITGSKFEEADKQIVPGMKKIEAAPENLPNWPWNNTIGSSDFIGDYARLIPYNANKDEKQWLDKTDLIFGHINNDHVVWVADENIQTKHPINDREFEVYNEYGGTKFYSGVPYADKFTRKAIKMPFKAWSDLIKLNHANTKCGRIYFWE